MRAEGADAGRIAMRAARDAHVLRALVGFAVIGAVATIAFSVIAFIFDPNARSPAGYIGGATLVCFLGAIGVAARKGAIPPRRANAAMMMLQLAFLAMFAAIPPTRTSANPDVYALLLLVIASFVYLSWAWATAGVVVTVLAAVATNLALQGRLPDGHWAYELGAAIVASLIIHQQRWTSLSRIDRLVSEAKLRNEDLEASRSLLADAREVARLAGWELDLRTDVVTFSPDFAKVTGLPIGTGATRDQFLAFVHPDDAVQIQALVRSGAARDAPETSDFRVATPDGATRWLATRAKWIGGSAGTNARLVCTVQDVTERKAAELRSNYERAVLEAQNEAALDAILVTDQDHRVRFANDNFHRLWGTNAAALTPDRSVEVLRSATTLFEEPGNALAQFRRLLANPTDRCRTELKLAGDRTVELYTAPVIGRRGESFGRVWYFRDVTEQRRIEQFLQRSERLAGLGTLVAGVAHEINNPLTYILGNSDLVELTLSELIEAHATDAEGEKLREARELLADTRAGIGRIANITKSLKRVARQGDTSRACVDLNSVIENALTVCRARLKNDVEIRSDLSVAHPVLVNEGEISQVLLNLLFNAGDALAGRSDGLITVSTRELENDVILSVTDNGPGIPVDARTRIFTPFFTTKPSGTGLGLSVSYQIAVDHGGSLTFQSSTHGTTFDLRLPLDVAPNLAPLVKT